MKKLFFLSAIALLTSPVFAQSQGITGKWVSQVNGAKLTMNVTNDAISIAADTSILSTESYTLSGDTLSVTESGSSLGCQGAGKYLVAMKNNGLTFTMVTDGCDARNKVFTGAAWAKAE